MLSGGCGLLSGAGLKKPYPFQEADLAALADNDWTGLIVSEPGAGKTVDAVVATARTGAKVTLVVAPKNTLKNAWVKTYRDFAGIEARIIGNGRKAEREALADFELGYPGVYLCSTQFMTRADTSEWWGDLCIVDEALDVATPILTTKGWSTLGDLEDGHTLNAICPFCLGRSPRNPVGGARTLRIRMVEVKHRKPEGDEHVIDEPVVVCESGTCTPFAAEVSRWVKGKPAWPWPEWEWLAQRLLDPRSVGVA